MAKDLLRYDKMIESAMRGVVRQAISEAALHGLPGAHHFYISFRTDHPGTVVPDFLKSRYPQEMTIVLQYQFWGLEIEEESFSVTLSFNNAHERLTVPFQAVTVFADPAAKFTLPFQAPPAPAGQTQPAVAEPAAKTEAPPPEPTAEETAAEDAKVVTLDAFRKK